MGYSGTFALAGLAPIGKTKFVDKRKKSDI